MPAMLVLSLLVAPPAVSPVVSAKPAATLEEVAWIAGRWRGAEGGKVSEETWNAPQGESMLGSFRMVGADGAVVFYEILVLRQVPEGVEMRIRHFDSALMAKEEKDAPMVFRLEEAGDERAVFSRAFEGTTQRLRYRRDKDTLTIRVEKGSGEPVEFALTLAH